MTEFIGRIAGFLMVASIVPYLWGVYTRRIVANPISWIIWTLVGFAFLVSSISANVPKENLPPLVFGFINPLLVAAMAFWKGKAKKPDWFDWVCAVLGLVAIVVWFFTKDAPGLIKYAMYIAILADMFAAVPTLRHVFTNPDQDRPAAWILFTLAWALALIILPDQSAEHLAIPLYMFTAGLLISYPIVRLRVKNATPFSQWI